ncbi:MAG: UDP-glucose 4-epimerase GalE [Ktedonobacterales bacterium]|nr:UDP-glucose 4-epimerase GalE [Ktedonobacterales bacterium]
MRVLVTGGAGYIGSVIVEELIRGGHQPVVYDSFVKGHASALDASVPCVRGDIRETDRLRAALTQHQIEGIIHMAALTEVEESIRQPEQYFENNVAGSVSVFRAMLEAGVKQLVFSSTGSLYADTGRTPFDEDDPTAPTNPYSETKLLVERMMRWLAEIHGLTCTALRYFNAAGASERNGEAHEPESHLIPNVLEAAAAGRTLHLFGTDYPTLDGTTVRDYIHVIDLAQAHLLSLTRTDPGLRVYNLGNGNGYSVRQVIATAREVTGLPLQIAEHPRRPGDATATVASSRRIRAELGWAPRYPELRSILATAWAWRQAHPHGYEAS